MKLRDCSCIRCGSGDRGQRLADHADKMPNLTPQDSLSVNEATRPAATVILDLEIRETNASMSEVISLEQIRARRLPVVLPSPEEMITAAADRSMADR